MNAMTKIALTCVALAAALPASALTEYEAAPVTMETVTIIGQREFFTDWTLMSSDFVPIGNTFQSRSDRDFGILMPSDADMAAAAAKAKADCIANCNNVNTKEKAVCENTATQIRTTTLVGSGGIFASKRLPIARRVLAKFGMDWIAELDPKWVIAGGLAGADEYLKQCNGFAAGRLATCLNTGNCKP